MIRTATTRGAEEEEEEEESCNINGQRQCRQILFVCVDIIIKILLSKLSAFVARRASTSPSLSTPTQQWQLPKIQTKPNEATTNSVRPQPLCVRLCVCVCEGQQLLKCRLTHTHASTSTVSHAHTHTHTLCAFILQLSLPLPQPLPQSLSQSKSTLCCRCCYRLRCAASMLFSAKFCTLWPPFRISQRAGDASTHSAQHTGSVLCSRENFQ